VKKVNAIGIVITLQMSSDANKALYSALALLWGLRRMNGYFFLQSTGN